MTRMQLERHQVWLYLAAIGLGLVVGTVASEVRSILEALLWPALLILLYVTFVQVPLLHLRDAFRDRRFLLAVLVGNFVLLPLLAFGLIQFLPPDPVLRLGVLLVLLVPCTDWFITFSQLGGGDTPRAIAVTPLNLMLQLLLLPIYVWLLLDSDLTASLPMVHVGAAVLIVLIPLVAAALTEFWMGDGPRRLRLRERFAVGPVPMLAIVVFLIAGAQVGAIHDAARVLPLVLPLFVAFLLLAALIAKAISLLMRLPAAQGRTLCFSLGTRNSFVVLPLALALPDGWAVAAVVIVVQSLVELLGMVFFLWWVPRRLFRG